MSFCLDKQVETELRSLSGNNICVDCDARGPQWASVSMGVFMCLECSGRHRALGVHISFVRSVSMDSWTEKQISMMRKGGNDKFNAFLAKYDVTKSTPIAKKYNSPAALLYKDRLLAEVEGRPLPTELPVTVSSNASSAATLGGSDPLPGESEADYVARQKRLQAEARERLRQKFGGSNGLSSGGGSGGGGGLMQGIGSDASYRPGSNNSATGIINPEIAAQWTQAISFVSSSVSALGETVVKSVNAPSANNNTAYANNNTNTNTNNNNSGNTALLAPETIDAYKQTIATGWSSLATQAVGIWSKATEVAVDVAQILTKPIDEEEESKFPRGTFTDPNANNNNTNTSSMNSSLYMNDSNSSSGGLAVRTNTLSSTDMSTTTRMSASSPSKSGVRKMGSFSTNKTPLSEQEDFNWDDDDDDFGTTNKISGKNTWKSSDGSVKSPSKVSSRDNMLLTSQDKSNPSSTLSPLTNAMDNLTINNTTTTTATTTRDVNNPISAYSSAQSLSSSTHSGDKSSSSSLKPNNASSLSKNSSNANMKSNATTSTTTTATKEDFFASFGI